MRHYSVYMPDHTSNGDTSLAARTPLAEFVKDGFSWPALFLGPVWLLWHWLWIEFFGYVAVAGIFVLIFNWLDIEPALQFAAQAVIAFGLALIGNDVWRAALERREFREVSTVSGERLDDCEVRFFAGLDVPAALGGAKV